MAQRNAPRMLRKGTKKIQLDMNTIIDRFSPILKVEVAKFNDKRAITYASGCLALDNFQ